MEKFGLFIKNLNKLSKFMPFLFKIYVEKNLCGENLCGEKMKNMRSGIAMIGNPVTHN